MTEFHDFLIHNNLIEEAEDLGWSRQSIDSSFTILEAEDREELKRKIEADREEYDILAFSGGRHELNRKAFSDSRMDIVLHPGKERKDSGMNHVDAEKASENNVAIGFSLKELPGDQKKQSQKLAEWRRNLKLCEKYDAPYIITTEAEKFSELRNPRDLASIINSLRYNGRKAISKFPEKIIEKNRRAQDDSQVRLGHEVLEE